MALTLSDRARHSPKLAASFRDPATGIDGHRPATWNLSHRGGGLALADPARTALIEIAAPEPASKAAQVLTQTVATIQQAYTDAHLLTTTNRQLDGLPAEVAVLAARNKAGTPLRVLITVARGRQKTYLLEVFVTDKVKQNTVIDAQAIINSLHLKQ